jgi:23S rRNA pseudouridine1911/1915/1917 synthase
MAALGLPLLGDVTYGKTPRDPALKEIAQALGRQALHARTLGFRHPATGTWLTFASEPPPDFARALAALRALDLPLDQDSGRGPKPRHKRVP